MKQFSLFLIFVFFGSMAAVGQSQNNSEMSAKPGPIIVCPAGDFNGHFHTPVSEKTIQNILQKANGDPCTTIIVDYIGFSQQAKDAFQAAVDIWAYSLSSSVPIRVTAHWDELDDGTLGAAGPALVVKEFNNAPNSDFFPVALANKLAGTDLYPQDEDIVAYFNSGANWYYGTDGNTPYNKYDLLSVVLHELGHGLGFISSSQYENGNGYFGLDENNTPIYYDRFLINGPNGAPLINMNASNLGNAFTGNNVYCNSPSAAAHLGGNNPKNYAPGTYSEGSSISHWDESTYGAGNVNSLMTPQIGAGEAIHNPGPTTLGLFEDMGWSLCESNVVDDCLTGNLILSETGICPGETAQASLATSATIPPGGGYGIYFYDVAADDGVFLYGINMPYTFDNDLNGVLSYYGIDAFEGQFELTGYVYTDGDDPSNTICAESAQSTQFTFYGANDQVCNPAPNCSTGNLILSVPGICPGETAKASLATPATIPPGGGYGIYFYDVAANDGIFLIEINTPYTFDNDLNGILSANGYNVFEGQFELTGYVYTNGNDASNTICAESAQSASFTFYGANDQVCNPDADCSTGNLILSETGICPGSSAVASLGAPAIIPPGGGYAIYFYDVAADEGLSVYGLNMPYTFDNDLNGLLSQGQYPPFSGDFELIGYVYTNPNNPTGSICAQSPTYIPFTFYNNGDPACIVGIEEAPQGSQGLTLFPNPAGSEVNVKIKNPVSGKYQITLTDMSGRVLYNYTEAAIGSENNHTIQVSDFAPGVYFVSIYFDNYVETKRMVITR